MTTISALEVNAQFAANKRSHLDITTNPIVNRLHVVYMGDAEFAYFLSEKQNCREVTRMHAHDVLTQEVNAK